MVGRRSVRSLCAFERIGSTGRQRYYGIQPQSNRVSCKDKTPTVIGLQPCLVRPDVALPCCQCIPDVITGYRDQEVSLTGVDGPAIIILSLSAIILFFHAFGLLQQTLSRLPISHSA